MISTSRRNSGSHSRLPCQWRTVERDGLSQRLRRCRISAQKSIQIALIDQLAAPRARLWPKLNDVVGQLQHLTAVLYYQHIVAPVPQVEKQFSDALCVSGMQPRCGLVEDAGQVVQAAAQIAHLLPEAVERNTGASRQALPSEYRYEQ